MKSFATFVMFAIVSQAVRIDDGGRTVGAGQLVEIDTACGRDNGGSDHAWAGSKLAETDASREDTRGVDPDFNSSRSSKTGLLAQTSAIKESTDVDPEFNTSRGNKAGLLAQTDAIKESTGVDPDFNSSRSNKTGLLAQTGAIKEATSDHGDFNSSRSNRASSLAQNDASRDATEATSYNSKRSPRY